MLFNNAKVMSNCNAGRKFRVSNAELQIWKHPKGKLINITPKQFSVKPTDFKEKLVAFV
jgi:hypothetical protein